MEAVPLSDFTIRKSNHATTKSPAEKESAPEQDDSATAKPLLGTRKTLWPVNKLLWGIKPDGVLFAARYKAVESKAASMLLLSTLVLAITVPAILWLSH
jgi:hypothetical protein